jgi:hypothetical protein
MTKGCLNNEAKQTISIGRRPAAVRHSTLTKTLRSCQIILPHDIGFVSEILAVSFQKYWRSSGIAYERERFRRDNDFEPQSRVLTRKLGCLRIERQAEKRLLFGK